MLLVPLLVILIAAVKPVFHSFEITYSQFAPPLLDEELELEDELELELLELEELLLDELDEELELLELDEPELLELEELLLLDDELEPPPSAIQTGSWKLLPELWLP